MKVAPALLMLLTGAALVLTGEYATRTCRPGGGAACCADDCPSPGGEVVHDYPAPPSPSDVPPVRVYSAPVYGSYYPRADYPAPPAPGPVGDPGPIPAEEPTPAKDLSADSRLDLKKLFGAKFADPPAPTQPWTEPDPFEDTDWPALPEGAK